MTMFLSGKATASGITLRVTLVKQGNSHGERSRRVRKLVDYIVVAQRIIVFKSRPGAPIVANDAAGAAGSLINNRVAIWTITGEEHDMIAGSVQRVAGLHLRVPIVFWPSGDVANIARRKIMRRGLAPTIGNIARAIDAGGAVGDAVPAMRTGGEAARQFLIKHFRRIHAAPVVGDSRHGLVRVPIAGVRRSRDARRAAIGLAANPLMLCQPLRRRDNLLAR